MFYYFVTQDPIMRDWHIHFPSNLKPIRMNGYSSSLGEENGQLLNEDAGYLRDLENAAAASNSQGISMNDLSKEAQTASEYELPLGSAGTASRRGSMPNSPNTYPSALSSLNPGSAAGQDAPAGTTSSHSPRMAAASVQTPRGPSPAAHANPFLSAPTLSRSTSKEGDKHSAEAGIRKA